MLYLNLLGYTTGQRASCLIANPQSCQSTQGSCPYETAMSEALGVRTLKPVQQLSFTQHSPHILRRLASLACV